MNENAAPRHRLLNESDAVKFIEDMTTADRPQARRVSVDHHHLPE
ncbi:MAG: hypothetical protein Q8K62_01050 [Thiobacillus sp.]|nr:hypothetical protein [Thiobacillus sp.]